MPASRTCPSSACASACRWRPSNSPATSAGSRRRTARNSTSRRQDPVIDLLEDAEGRDRQGRLDAPRLVDDEDRRRHARLSDLRQAGNPRAAPASLRVQHEIPRADGRSKGFVISGTSPDGALVEIIELKDHPFFLACQFHPEFQSKPNKPHPLFKGFVTACLGTAARHPSSRRQFASSQALTNYLQFSHPRLTIHSDARIGGMFGPLDRYVARSSTAAWRLAPQRPSIA